MCVDLTLRSVCLFLDEAVSLSVYVSLVCLSLFVSVCVSQYVCPSVCILNMALKRNYKLLVSFIFYFYLSLINGKVMSK